MTYTNVFGSATLPPAEYGYASFTLTTNATLVWPYNTDGSSYPVAKVMDIACDAGNEVTLPDCTEVSTGEDFLIRNVGANVLIVKDAKGVQVASVAVGAASYFYLTDNTSAAGVFGVIGFGVGTSTADASSLVGYGVKAVGASLNQAHPVQPTNTGITLSADHRAKLVVFTGGVATFTLETAATLGDDYFTMFRNDGTGTATIDPAASELIDGMTSMQVQPGESLMLICTGIKWYSVGYGRSTLYQFTQLTKDVSAGGTITLSATEAANKLITFIGNPSAAVEVVVPAVVAVYYTQSAISTAQIITLKTAAGSGVGISQGARVISLCDGTNVVSAQSAVANTSVSLTDGSALVPSLFFATQTNTGLFKSGTQDVGVTVGGSTVGVFGSTGLQTATIGPNSTQRHTLPAVPSDTVTLNTATQTLTNKTISVDNNTVSGIAASSFVLSDGSGNIDGTAAQKVIPTGVVVGTTDTQTLTNKTLTAPVINSPTGITKADVGLGNVDNTSDADKPISTATQAALNAQRNSLLSSSGSSLVGYLPAGTGAVATDVQTKLRESVSVKDFGAVGDGVADDTAAFSNAAAASGFVKVPPGVYYMPSAPSLGSTQFLIEKGVSATGAYGGSSVFTTPSPGVIQPNSSPNELATTHIRRQANHTGGTPGYVSSALRAETFASANNTNFEWAILGLVYNQANSGENVGVYGQGVRAANGPTWGMVAEGRDTTNTANPTSGLLGIEVDIFANGTDNNNNRVGIDVVAGQGLTGGNYAECRVYAGIRVVGRNVAGDVGSFYNGLVVNSATYAGIALSNTGTFGILFSANANVQIGVDFSGGAFAQSAMRFARQQNIALEDTGTIKIQTIGASDARLRFINTASEVLGINIENNATTARLVVSGTCASGLDLTGGTYSTAGIRVPRAATLFTLEETNTIKVQSLGASDARLRFINTASEVLGINIENNATTARLVVSGTCAHGVDFSGATIGTTAIKMARGQGVSWEQTNTITQALDASLDVLRLNYSGAEKIGLIVSGVDSSNGIRINGTNVVGPRKTGWVGPTGTADRTTFDTSTVTLANLAQRVKALIDDLTSHGLIGP